MDAKHKILLNNRKIEYDYTIIKRVICGIQLTGYEVKAIRQRRLSIVDSFASVKGGEMYLMNFTISLSKDVFFKSKDCSRYKLLLRKNEILYLQKRLEKERGTTLVPTAIVEVRHLIKCEIALVKGKKKYDKRESIKKRDLDREFRRNIKHML